MVTGQARMGGVHFCHFLVINPFLRALRPAGGFAPGRKRNVNGRAWNVEFHQRLAARSGILRFFSRVRCKLIRSGRRGCSSDG
jgi:hypothetical protein